MASQERKGTRRDGSVGSAGRRGSGGKPSTPPGKGTREGKFFFSFFFQPVTFFLGVVISATWPDTLWTKCARFFGSYTAAASDEAASGE